MDPCMVVGAIVTACTSADFTPSTAPPQPTDPIRRVPVGADPAPSATIATPEVSQTCPSPGEQPKPKMECALATQGGPVENPMAALDRQRRLAVSSTGRAIPPQRLHPTSGDQLFAFRTAALQAGVMYNRASAQRYYRQWQQPSHRASYSQWRRLIALEAAVMARSQGNNRLTILLGDSLSLWLPTDQLPQDRFWLNQSLSGETTDQILARLSYFRDTRPNQIHLMAGINDLKNGASDREVISNIQQIVQHLQRQHPRAEVVVYALLPTRLSRLPSDRIRHLNHQIAHVADYHGAGFIDLQSRFTDHRGLLRQDLTTDGLHLSEQGYALWQAALTGL